MITTIKNLLNATKKKLKAKNVTERQYVGNISEFSLHDIELTDALFIKEITKSEFLEALRDVRYYLKQRGYSIEKHCKKKVYEEFDYRHNILYAKPKPEHLVSYYCIDYTQVYMERHGTYYHIGHDLDKYAHRVTIPQWVKTLKVKEFIDKVYQYPHADPALMADIILYFGVL